MWKKKSELMQSIYNITFLLQCSSCTVHCVILQNAFLFPSTISLGSKVEDKKKKKKSRNNIPNKLLLTITIQHGHINGTLKKIEFVEN